MSAVAATSHLLSNPNHRRKTLTSHLLSQNPHVNITILLLRAAAKPWSPSSYELPEPGENRRSGPPTKTFKHCFSKSQDGFLYCEVVKVQDIKDALEGAVISKFPLENIVAVARIAGKEVNVLLHSNPDVDPQVHLYVATGNNL